jgi:hypothetical protein
VRTVGDMGELPTALPSFLLPGVPFTLETLQIILPYSLTMAAVGLLESMTTAQILDDLTDTPSLPFQACPPEVLRAPPGHPASPRRPGRAPADVPGPTALREKGIPLSALRGHLAAG